MEYEDDDYPDAESDMKYAADPKVSVSKYDKYIKDSKYKAGLDRAVT